MDKEIRRQMLAIPIMIITAVIMNRLGICWESGAVLIVGLTLGYGALL